MFKKLREQAYTISHPAESICIGFLIWTQVSDKDDFVCFKLRNYTNRENQPAYKMRCIGIKFMINKNKTMTNLAQMTILLNVIEEVLS
jgi:hypothetical protein